MIDVEHLSKRYGETLAVDDLSFEIRPGMVTGFLGPNGAGKSTTMRLIVGLDKPSAGSVTVDGRRYRDLPAPLREVGAMLEARAIHTGRSAYHHLLAMAQTNRIAKTRVDEVIELVQHASKNAAVLVRSARGELLQRALAGPGVVIESLDRDVLEVHGLSGREIGEVALREGVALEELTPRQASLEDAFMAL